MAVGAGRAPAGVSPYGYGTPATATARDGKPLMGALAVRHSGRKIDQATRQYVYDEHGRAVGESRVHQMVKLVAMTARRSCVLADLGHELDTVKDITANFTQTVQSIFARAYQRMVDAGLIELREVLVQQSTASPSRALIVVRFKDLDTGLDDEVSV